MSENWVKIILDSSHFTAGERVSGEINSCTLAEDPRILLKSQGIETLMVQSQSHEGKSHSNKIYSLNEELSDIIHSPQSVVPFTFKIPQYAPASFDYKDTDESGNQISSEIFYTLEVELVAEGQVLAQESLRFTVLNKLSRVVVPPSVDSLTPLTSCCCISRGVCQIVIESLNNLHVKCYETKKYKIGINSRANNRLESVIAQLIFDVHFEVPGGKPVFKRRIIARCVPEIVSLKKEAENVEKLEFIFDAELKTGCGENACSNQSAFFRCEYRVQVLAIYDVGCRSKRSDFEVFLQVNPTSIPQKKPELPPDWNPRENNLRSLLISVGSTFEKQTDD